MIPEGSSKVTHSAGNCQLDEHFKFSSSLTEVRTQTFRI